MAIGSLTTHYLVDVTNNDDGNVTIRQIEDFNIVTNITNIYPDPADGLPDPQYIALERRETRMSGTTSRLSVLGEIGISGLVIDGAIPGAAVTTYLQEYQLGGARKSGSAHTSLVFGDGIIIPTTLTIPETGHATLGFEMLPISTDGTTDPITKTGSQALSGTAGTDELFRLAKFMLNGSQVAGLISATVNFGIELTVQYGDGGIYPTFVAIEKRMPFVDLVFRDKAALTAAGFDGVAQGATDSILYLRKVSEGGKTVADNTGEHISFTFDEGRFQVDDIGGSPYEYRARFTPTYDGTAAIMVISTSATIV